ncbi:MULTISPECIES: monovalent cation/H(+) antiporter subunit G [unclassified Nocardiopsis]|jgi:multicomponent Na+:H+ antiporter subunit G|uniref:monovalent cation/H(+) antiporter subunit G n=1 Tax=unclassified Nocardiopsis TaxID=2649073 RepID=UPI00066CB913|nr:MULTISPECIES: monovalent cation/H(+) antiporter subunit G [unclassified Nocardiopsis]MBQ1079994.1 monovalent cation/H(+) antiporter subunit G [Nocardiopsis sp. B62]
MNALDVAGIVCMVAGALVFLVGAVGLLRLQDFYARLSGVGIAGGLGTALVLLGLLLHYPTVENAVKIGLALLIQLATAAVGGNAIARAGYLTGVKPTENTAFDDLAATEREA